MGVSQGASHRLVTARTKMAMPETTIGLFPDVGGGYFLSRCPGSAGAWLALTGTTLGATEAIELGLADHCLDAQQLPQAWEALAALNPLDKVQMSTWIATFKIATNSLDIRDRGRIDQYFSMSSVAAIVQALEADSSDWAQRTASQLRQRSPLMLGVAFGQVHAMLIEAATRTEGVSMDSAPQVFQTALNDWYPVYRLVCHATPTEPRPRALLLSALHASIQDVFNTYGVQIMSPQYFEDPKDAKVVPPAKWYPAPAIKPDGTQPQ